MFRAGDFVGQTHSAPHQDILEGISLAFNVGWPSGQRGVGKTTVVIEDPIT